MREPGAHRLNGRNEIAVTGDDNCDIEEVVVCIVEEANGDVDVGLLLLVLLLAVSALVAGDRLGEEVAVVDLDFASCKQSVYEDPLSLGLPPGLF